METLELICLGDLHLGRRTGRLGASQTTPGPVDAWRRVVDEAVRRQVAAVLLAGDVIDRDNVFHESMAALVEGATKLDAAGVRVFAVAGNHDATTLRRVDERVAGFHMLGRDGAWEIAEVGGVAIAGWSFPDRFERQAPIDELDVSDLGGDAPALGLLHADFVAGEFSPSQLESVGRMDAWLLGHIHAPTPGLAETNRPIGYLGSVVGLGPKEDGERGAWLCRVRGRGDVRMERLAVAPLRWETLGVDVSKAPDAGRIESVVTECVEAWIGENAGTLRGVTTLAVRAELRGRSPRDASWREDETLEDLRQMTGVRDGLTWRVHDVRDATEPAVDLSTLARGSDPIAVLAADLIALERDDQSDRRTRLIDDARESLRQASAHRAWSGLPDDLEDDDAIAATLQRAGRAAIEHLLRQQEAMA